jgi:hypothetical protein
VARVGNQNVGGGGRHWGSAGEAGRVVGMELVCWVVFHLFSSLASFPLLYYPHPTTIASIFVCMCYASLPWLRVELSLFLLHDLYVPDLHRYRLRVLPPVTGYLSPLHQSRMYVYKPMSWLPHRHLENQLRFPIPPLSPRKRTVPRSRVLGTYLANSEEAIKNQTRTG